MTHLSTLRTNLRFAAVGAAALTLSGCFVNPGKFDSQLDLNDNGTFSFAYDGQIFLAALSDEFAGEEVFQPECLDDAFEERKCTPRDIREQRAEWDANAEQRAETRARDARMAAALLGGIDPSDPDAATKLAAQLERQAGWNDVNYAGNGVFDVSYAVSGTLSHDFTFPTMERLAGPSPFIQLTRRDDGSIRIDAPGFAPASGNTPMDMILGSFVGMAGAASGFGDQVTAGDTGDSGPPSIPVDGSFRIMTNGRILANNTDAGPSMAGGKQQLTWEVNSLTKTAPMALVQTDLR